MVSEQRRHREGEGAGENGSGAVTGLGRAMWLGSEPQGTDRAVVGGSLLVHALRHDF